MSGNSDSLSSLSIMDELFDLVDVFPIELASLVFAQLPVDSRLRCREVSPAWRAFLSDTRFWQVCDLSLTSGVERRTPALLHAASERAQGTLRELDVSGWYNEKVRDGEVALGNAQLVPIIEANAASLLELRAWKPVDSDEGGIATASVIEELLAAAPRLRLLECDAGVLGAEAQGPLPRLLREPQFAPLRLLKVGINAEDVQPPLDVPAVAAWAATHTSLKRLELWHAPLNSELALDAVANLALSQLQYLDLFKCRLSPASLPALTRMLGSGSHLMVLRISNNRAPLLVGVAVPAFCTALRASRLKTLDLSRMRLWESQADGLAVIAACAAHPTLRTLYIQHNGLDQTSGTAAIVAALDTLQASIPGLHLRRR